jgi:hypothetical protein
MARTGTQDIPSAGEDPGGFTHIVGRAQGLLERCLDRDPRTLCGVTLTRFGADEVAPDPGAELLRPVCRTCAGRAGWFTCAGCGEPRPPAAARHCEPRNRNRA